MDIAKKLGALEGYGTQKLCLYIPNKDKNGTQLDNSEKWVNEAREILSRT